MLNDAWKDEPYIKEWLSKVAERTQKNYKERFPKWLRFINMTPTEQIQKRFKDLQSQNPKERGFFEDKTVEFKNALITQNLNQALARLRILRSKRHRGSKTTFYREIHKRQKTVRPIQQFRHDVQTTALRC